MKVIKRNGSEAPFDRQKIIMAISKANASVTEENRLDENAINAIADSVEKQCGELGREATVEDIQDMVEKRLTVVGSFALAKHYITYRYTRSLARKSNTVT